MFKSIANTFKRNHKIEIAMDLAGKSFGIYPKKLTEQMPLGMRQDWRKEMSDAAQAMDLNNHEFSAMLVIAFIGSIQDRHHKDLIETVCSTGLKTILFALKFTSITETKETTYCEQ